MVKGSSKKIAFVSSFLPRKCGIATFTNDLINSVSTYAGSEFSPLVVAMSNDNYEYREPVAFEIRPNVKNDYISAAEYLNFSNVHAVSIQHEFGLFGGAAGSYLSLFLDNVNAPIITTLHTIISEPQPDYYKSMVQLCAASDRLVVMNGRGIKMLAETYNVPLDKIELIPHGLPDLSFVDSSYYKHKFGFDDRKTILTFGLIGRGKGIEVMLEAMPEIIRAEPRALYIVLGVTHPELVKFEGESYRLSLQRMVKDLGIQNNVIFYNRFVSDAELHDFLCATDIYATPYLHREQLTSGTLAFAVGSGKAVVSTPYWAAEELLEDGRGKLVRFGDSKDLAQAVVEILKNETLFHSMRRKAYDYGRTRTWPVLGEPYWKLFSRARSFASTPAATAKTSQSTTLLELPDPRLDHLIRLTDDTGLLQHAKFIIPDRSNGYCTDDNARAIVVMTKYFKQYSSPEALKLFEYYLSFLCHSLRPDGTVYNFMDYNRNFRIDEPAHDALGRTLWAFGSVIASPPVAFYLSVIKEFFDYAAKHIPSMAPRGMAYSIFGLSDYLIQFPGASEIKRLLAHAADSLVELNKKHSASGWNWFEEFITYDNAILPASLFTAALALGEKKYLRVAEKTCSFLLENTYNGRHFSFVGSNGWYPKGKQRAQFDQQPIEVASTVIMLRTAYEATMNTEYLKLQRKAFDWFLGENDLHMPVYDFQTKGCCDGLGAGGVNINQGAESIVSFLLALLNVVESFTATYKSTVPEAGKNLIDSQSYKIAIKDIPANKGTESIEEVY
jgi:glycosyltransferase involved in cell wall biosynthesis